MAEDLPEHITVKREQTIHAICHDCDAQAHIGEYPDPDRADVMLTEWLARHQHRATTHR